MQSVITPHDCTYYVKAFYAGYKAKCIYHGDSVEDAVNKYKTACKNAKITRCEIWSHGKCAKIFNR